MLTEDRRLEKRKLKLKRITKKNENRKSKTKVKDLSKSRTSVAITDEQLEKFLECVGYGFEYIDDKGVNRIFRSNKEVLLAILLMSNLGLRLSDVVYMKVKNVSSSELSIIEQKTKKPIERKISPVLYQMLIEYALERGLTKEDFFISIGERAIQKQIKIVRDVLGYPNISAHSFRKHYATKQYYANDKDLLLVQRLLNHSNPSITKEYIGLTKEAVNNASQNFNSCLEYGKLLKV